MTDEFAHFDNSNIYKNKRKLITDEIMELTFDLKILTRSSQFFFFDVLVFNR